MSNNLSLSYEELLFNLIQDTFKYNLPSFDTSEIVSSSSSLIYGTAGYIERNFYDPENIEIHDEEYLLHDIHNRYLKSDKITLDNTKLNENILI